MRLKKRSLLLLVVLLLAACAPADLDITPSVTPSNTPEPTPTRTPTPEAAQNTDPAAQAAEETEEAPAVTGNQVVVDNIVNGLPQTINAGATSWRRTRDEITGQMIIYQQQESGITARVFYAEPGGGYSELTFGAFDTPEAARSFYDAVADRTRTLENAETRDEFPTPNLFGSGLYGSDAIFVQGDLYVRISVPRFSSTTGEPLSPYARALFRVFEQNGVPFGS